jgi:hypothetical protein
MVGLNPKLVGSHSFGPMKILGHEIDAIVGILVSQYCHLRFLERSQHRRPTWD